MKNPGWANNRGSPPDNSRNSSYQIPLLPNAPVAMILKAKAAYGDDDDSPSHTGLCSDFYVFKRVLTPLKHTRGITLEKASSRTGLSER
jgi:hypothetical protein